MKRIIALALITIALSAQSQTTCTGSLVPTITISQPCASICVQNTGVIGGGGYCNKFVFTASGANSYTWNVNGTKTLMNQDTAHYGPVYFPGNTFYEVTGSITYGAGLTCTAMVTVWGMAQTCSVNTTPVEPEVPTGIAEYQLNQYTPVYYDLLGNRALPNIGQLLIEHRGTVRRKVIITP
jgi:hypothetical protein